MWLALVAHATIGAALQMQLGNPSNASTDGSNHTHYLIQRDQYALDYNDTTHEPNWVSWDLTSDDVGGSGRSSFIQDTTLPLGFYQVLTTDYSGSGYDRGHMCPSADRTVTTFDNQQVFYMSNMIPQAPDNNQGVWANFESYCRSLASSGNEVLITSGPSLFGGSTIASGVAIPGYTWKIAVVVPLGSGTALTRVNASTRVIAIKIPNIAGVRNTPWQNFVTSVAQIEADTGYHFFTALPASVANALRVVVDGQTAVGAPSIVVQPSNQTTVVGGSATFSVTASGDAPLTYQWSKDDVEIAGATGASLTVAGVQASDVGSYDVVVANGVGAVTSNSASLIVTGLPPSIVTPPASQTVNAGSTVTFAVTASGSPTLTYQWRKGGSPIAFATTSTLTLTNVQGSDAADYDVVVTNSVNSATSTAATLDVTPAGPTIVTQPVNQTTTLGSNAGFSVVATGTNPLAYQWRKGGVALVDGGVISGATTASLTLTGVSAVDAANYDVVVTNALNSVTSMAAGLSVNAPAPAAIYWNFTATDGSAATNATTDVAASVVTQGNNNGTTALITSTSASGSYAGASGGNNAGAAARTGALVKGASGSAYFEFTLTPIAGKRLVLNGITFGTRSTSTGPQAYDIYTSLDGFTAPVATGTISATSVWALKSPTFTTQTGGTNAPVTVRIYGYNGAGSASASTANWRIDDLTVTASTVFPPPTAPVVTATTPASASTNVDVATPITVTFNEPVSFTGSWFTISSASSGGTAATVTGGPVTYTLTPPSNFAYSDTITVNILGAAVVDQATATMHGASNTTFSFTTGIYTPPVPPSVTTQPSPQSVNVGGSASFTVAASGTAPLNYQWRKGGTPITGNASALTSTLTLSSVTTADAGDYDCVVSNVAGSDVSQVAALNVTIVPPTITTQPTAQGTTFGGTASFTVAASGTAPFSYQWRKNGAPLANSSSVSGVNSATLVLTGATDAADGVYDVIVSNAAAPVTSQGATLAVLDTLTSIYWDFASASPTSGIPANVTGGTVTQGNNNGTTTLLTTTSASSSYAGASGGNNAGAAARIGALNTAAAGSAYFEFTFAPAGGRQFAATAISFGMRSTGTGPQAFALYSSVDGFTNPIAAGAVTNDSAWHLYTPTVAGTVGAAGSPVTFRLYGFNGAGSPASGTANWRIDDFKLTAGVLALPPTAPVVVSTTPADSATNVPLATPITVTFDQPVNVTGTWFTITGSASGAVAATASGGPTTFTLTPATSFAYNETVSTTIVAAQVREQATNTLAMAANANFAFTTLPPTPPSIVNGPASQTATVGDNVTFHVDAAGTAPFSYQWRKGTNPISGATGDTLTLSSVTTADAGDYDVVVTNIATAVTSPVATLLVNKAAATVTLGALGTTFSGSAQPVSVTTTPAGLAVDVTYDGSATVPVNAGSYAVVATINDANYVGTATGTLTIAKAAATVTISGTSQTYDGTAKAVSATTAPSGLSTAITYDGSSTAPTSAGSYAVVASITDVNFSGSTSATLVVAKANATITFSGLTQQYDGLPKTVSATTTPAGLTVAITYDGAATAPTNPGAYAVLATVNDANYTASASATLVVGVTALVRHAPTLDGGLDGSVQVLSAESMTLNSNAWISGDLLVPGLPTVRLNGQPTFAGVLDGAGLATPANYEVTLNGRAVLRYLVRRTNAIALPTVSAPPQSTGTRSVTLNSASDLVGDFATVRNLTLNGNAGDVAVPAGTYGTFVANGNGRFTLGVAGATTPAVYNLQSLTFNGNATLRIVGPVVINLANGAAFNGSIGNATHPEWLALKVANGGVTLNGNVALAGYITAPNGTVIINGNSTLTGGVASDRLTINGNGALKEP